MDQIYVTSNYSPDLDGFACVTAYVEFLNKQGVKATSAIFGDLRSDAEYIKNRFDIPFFKIKLSPESLEKIVLVDTSYITGPVKGMSCEAVIEVFDHRIINDAHLFPNAKIQIESVGACSTLITERFMKDDVYISQTSASLLYSAIASNTLNFQSTNTTDRDRKAFQWLEERANPPIGLIHDMFLDKSNLAGDKLKKVMDEEFGFMEINGKKIGFFQVEMIDGEELIKTRKQEIIDQLNLKQKELNLDFVFLSILGLEENCNFFVIDDEKTKELLRAIFQLDFQDGVALRSGLIMRKQITPLIQKELQRN